MTARRSVLLFGALLGACTGTTPANEILAPDPAGIMVFFPTVDGTVYGRGLPGSFKDPRVQYARVEAQPTGTFEPAVNVEEDGSFEFHLIAVSNDTLEIRGQLDKDGSIVGDSTYIKVPEERIIVADQVCCVEATSTDGQGFCESVFDREERIRRGDPCPVGIQGISTKCKTDNECGIDEGELIVIDPARITISPPNEKGEIDVTGVVAPNALVTLENRELNGIGVPSRVRKHFKISSDCPDMDPRCVPGTFKFLGISARGDDELVIQAMLLSTTRSAPTSFKVPDAEMVGVDVLGAEAWEGAPPLQNGRRGPIAVYISPYGKDGRGICPDLPEGEARHPETCWSGGLTHDMVEFITEGGTTIDSCNSGPRPTVPGGLLPYNRGFDGDVRTPAQDVAIVIDMTSRARDSEEVPASPQRFAKIANFIRDLRARDRIGVVLFGGESVKYTGVVNWKVPGQMGATTPKPGIRWLGVDNPADVGLVDAMVEGDGRGALIQEVLALDDSEANEDPKGADIYDGIRSAIDMLTKARSSAGRIIVIGYSKPDPPGATFNPASKIYDIEHRDEVDRLTGQNERIGSRGITVDFVDINGNDVANDDVTTTVDFSGTNGGTNLESPVNRLDLTLLELRRKIAGSFILLYDMYIPRSAGKRGELRFQVRVTVPYIDPAAGRRNITVVSPPTPGTVHTFTIKIDGSDGGCLAGTPGCDMPCMEN